VPRLYTAKIPIVCCETTRFRSPHRTGSITTSGQRAATRHLRLCGACVKSGTPSSRRTAMLEATPTTHPPTAQIARFPLSVEPFPPRPVTQGARKPHAAQKWGGPCNTVCGATRCAVQHGVQAGGEGGIRTHGGLAPTAVFKTAAINHSATPPQHPRLIAGLVRRWNPLLLGVFTDVSVRWLHHIPRERPFCRP
jgi:hypothetical protein